MINVEEERKYCGIPLEEQRRNYRSSFKPSEDVRFIRAYGEGSSSYPNYCLQIAKKQLKAVTKAKDLGDLVKPFIIHNLNDFKPYQDWKDPNNPSEEEFRDLLADHARWERRYHRYISSKKNEVIRSQLNLLNAAKTIYQELSILVHKGPLSNIS